MQSSFMGDERNVISVFCVAFETEIFVVWEKVFRALIDDFVFYGFKGKKSVVETCNGFRQTVDRCLVRFVAQLLFQCE